MQSSEKISFCQEKGRVGQAERDSEYDEKRVVVVPCKKIISFLQTYFSYFSNNNLHSTGPAPSK